MLKSIKVEDLNSYLLCKPNGALRVFTSALEIEFNYFDPRGKIVQTVKILLVCQNTDLTS